MILITGAAGFIGSNLVASLNSQGRDDLVLCDWLGNDGRWENLAKRSFSHFFDPDGINDFLESEDGRRVDVILHMGAVSDTSAKDGDLVIGRNYLFTKKLWRWCASRGVTFVYASSAATYGDGADGFDDDRDLGRLKRLRPLNLYGWSKHIFDLYALNAPELAPPKWYGLKFFNVFGPNEYHKGAMRSVVCKAVVDILASRPVCLFKSYDEQYCNGGQMRDFVWIEDACAAVVHFSRGTAPSGLYNVGSGRARSFADLVGAAFKTIDRAPNIDYVAMPDEIRDRYQYFTQADVAKLRDSGFDQPFLDLEASVSRYVEAFLLRADPYR